MGCAVVRFPSRHFVASAGSAFPPPSMPHTVLRGRLGSLIASWYLAALAPSMSGAKSSATHCGLGASRVRAPLASSMRGTEEFVTRTLGASWMSTATPSTMRDTEFSGSLCTLGAVWVLTSARIGMHCAVGRPATYRLRTALCFAIPPSSCIIGLARSVAIAVAVAATVFTQSGSTFLVPIGISCIAGSNLTLRSTRGAKGS